jgi:hypothetical protein
MYNLPPCATVALLVKYHTLSHQNEEYRKQDQTHVANYSTPNRPTNKQQGWMDSVMNDEVNFERVTLWKATLAWWFRLRPKRNTNFS